MKIKKAIVGAVTGAAMTIGVGAATLPQKFCYVRPAGAPLKSCECLHKIPAEGKVWGDCGPQQPRNKKLMRGDGCAWTWGICNAPP